MDRATPSHSWTIPGAEGQPILGATDTPSDEPGGVALIVHGFLGYKDYGMFPRIARELAGAGIVAHRFNLSHSGMTDAIETFERPDLFERDTWNKQVTDIDAVIDAVAAGEIAGRGLPLVILGHSRGGVSTLRCAARRFRAGRRPLPAGLITLATPDSCCAWDESRKRQMLDRGFEEITSNRTGQTLRIDAAWLREQIADPEAHDVLAHVRDIACPLLVIHGEADPTVPSEAARNIVDAAGERARLVLIEDANHVFDTPNPMPPDAEPSASLRTVLEEVTGFARGCCAE